MTSLSEQTTKTTKVISSVVLLTLLAKLMGFFREIMLSAFFGATGISDAYLISQNIPGIIFTFVGTGLTTCYIPIYYRVLEEKGKEDAIRFTNRLLLMILGVSLVIVAFIWCFTQPIVKLFAMGFEGDTLYYAIWFTRISCLSLFFSALLYVFSSYLQANRIFTVTAFAAVPNSLCVMLGIYLGAKLNLWLLSVFSVFAIVVQLLVLVPSIRKTGYHLRLDSSEGTECEYIKAFFVLIGPVIIGVSINQVNLLIDRTIASGVTVGGISALTYADSLIQFIQGGLVQPVITVYYPQIANCISRGNYRQAVAVFRTSLNMLLSLLIPITAGLIVYSKPIVELLFMRGAFDAEAVSLTCAAVRFYALGICFVAAREFLSRFFYANSDTRTPMINATIGVIANIALNLTLSRMMGISGLALATSVSALVTVVLLWISGKRRKILEGMDVDGREMLKIAVGTVISIAASFGVFSLLPFGATVNMLFGVGVAVLIYVAFAALAKMDIFQMITGMIRK